MAGASGAAGRDLKVRVGVRSSRCGRPAAPGTVGRTPPPPARPPDPRTLSSGTGPRPCPYRDLRAHHDSPDVAAGPAPHTGRFSSMRPDLQQDPRPEFGIPVPRDTGVPGRHDGAAAGPQGPWSGPQPAAGPWTGNTPVPGPYSGPQPAVGPYSGPQPAAPRPPQTGSWSTAERRLLPGRGPAGRRAHRAPPAARRDPVLRADRLRVRAAGVRRGPVRRGPRGPVRDGRLRAPGRPPQRAAPRRLRAPSRDRAPRGRRTRPASGAARARGGRRGRRGCRGLRRDRPLGRHVRPADGPGGRHLRGRHQPHRPEPRDAADPARARRHQRRLHGLRVHQGHEQAPGVELLGQLRHVVAAGARG